jgi:hypothetical protein
MIPMDAGEILKLHAFRIPGEYQSLVHHDA